NQEYPFEKMGFNGKTVYVASLKPGVYSTLGKFFMEHEMLFREGLIGGTLSSAWPLLDLSQRGAKLKYDGTSKIDGRETYVLEYIGKNNTGLEAKLYFDAQTFQHVRTKYEQRITKQMPGGPSVTQQEAQYINQLIEDFSDFKPEGDLTLPHSYKLQLVKQSPTQRVLQDWIFTLTKFS